MTQISQYHFNSRDHLKIGKTSGDFSRCVIDVGCHWSGLNGKRYKSQFNVPCIFIDADQFALDNLSIEKDDLMILAAVSSSPGIGCFHFYLEQTHSLNEIDYDTIEQYRDGYTGQPVVLKDWTEQERRYIPKITLESVIRDLNIQEVCALKVDAQGHDLEVVKGLGSMIKRVSILELEVAVTEFNIYKNEHKKQETLTYMNSWGFELVTANRQSYGQEENLVFRNTKR